MIDHVISARLLSQAQLIDARTKAEVQRIEAEAQAIVDRHKAAARAEAETISAENEATVQSIRTSADVAALRERETAAAVYTTHPALLRLRELETLRELAGTANARLYISFNGERHTSERDD